MIKIGIIGCGYWGPNIIRNFYETDGTEVAICCDLNPDRLDFIEKRYPSIKITEKYLDVLKDPRIDAVAIATPVSTHFALAKEALSHNKHVFVEKPICSTSLQAASLIDFSNKKKKVLMVGHVFEYTAAVNKIKEIIESGEIGNVFYFNAWRVNLGIFQHDINVIWDLASHDISILYYILKEKPLSLNATGISHVKSGMENIAYITLHFKSNLIAHIHVNWLSPVKIRQIVIGGDKKMIIYDDIEPSEKVKIYDKGITIKNKNQEDTLKAELQIEYRSGDVYLPKLEPTEALRVECRHFLDCILNKRTPRSDGESGLRVVKTLEAAQRSLENHGRKEKIDV